MKQQLGNMHFKNFVMAQIVSFLVLFEKVGRKNDGLDCMITLLPFDIILPYILVSPLIHFSIYTGRGPPMVVGCV